MIPILYEANETEFNHGGIGSFTDAVSAFSIEERNGKFELEMKYPLKGKLFHELKNDRLIKANVSYVLKNQRFKIIRITKPSKGIVTVYAEHVSNLSSDLPLEPEVNYSGNAQSALNTWSWNIVDDHPFTVFSDIQTESNGRWTIDKVENARRALGGVAGSILQAYGGEYRFDNYRISLLAQRGNDNGTTISYGRNLIDLEQEESIDNTYTSIYPYSIINHDDGSEELITLPERFIDSEHVNKFARRKILTVDFSDDEIKSVEELRTRTQQFIEQNEIGVPKVNLKVRFIDLARTQEYKDLLEIEQIDLCDWVYIRFSDLDIIKKAKVIKIKWNILLDRYEEIEVGEARSTLSTEINLSADNRINDKLDPVTQRLNIIMTAANGKNKNFYGPDEPTGDLRTGDAWYKSIGDGEFELYIYNGHSWGDPVVTTGVNNEVNQRLEEAKSIAETARDNTHLLQLDADSILAGLGLDGITETNQTIVNQIKVNVGDRIDHLVGTKVSEDSIQYQSLIERYDLYERVIGSTEEGVETNVSRIVQSSNIIQTEVSSQLERGTEDTLSDKTQRFIPPNDTVTLSLSKPMAIGTRYEFTFSVSQSVDNATSVRVEGASAVPEVVNTLDGRTYYRIEFTPNQNMSILTVRNTSPSSIVIRGESLIHGPGVFDRLDSLSTTVTQVAGSWALRLESNDDLVAGINASSNGVYIAGKNIILDGDTIVDGSFTVTDEIFAEEMNITKFTAGTLDAADVNIINLNANSLVTGTINAGSDSSWNLNTGVFATAGVDTRTTINNGEINFQSIEGVRYGGMRTERFDDGALGLVIGSGELRMTQNRLETLRSGNRHLYIVPSGTGRVMVRSITGEHYPIQASQFLLENTSSRLRMVSGNTRLEASSILQLYAHSDQLAFEIGSNINVEKNINMRGNTITNQSDIRLKTNVEDSKLDALKEIERLKFIDYDWDLSNPANKNKSSERKFGIVAQYSPFLQTKTADEESYLSVDLTKQVNLNSKAIQELLRKVDEIDERTSGTKSNQ